MSRQIHLWEFEDSSYKTTSNEHQSSMGSIAYADITQAPAPLPSAKLEKLKPGLSLQPPLTRLGSGPGLILITTPEIYDEKLTQRDDAPTPVLKWAEEGYAVFQVSAEALGSDIATVFVKALHAFKYCETCRPKDKVGLICESSLSQFRLLDGC
jgi:carboxymethylenebutenolidase